VLGDISGVRSFEPSWSGRFSVIECCGVLHHMADPFAAWRDLLACLAPGGIMLIGLYSAVARRDLDVLRQEAIYPGAGCDDQALRRYRQALLARGPETPGAGYLKSRDIFTTSGFRDFFLHVSEKPTSIPDIQRFLDANGLVFRGFVNAPFGALRQRFPNEAWPGRLECWAELEAERPQLFIGMYQFWLTRRAR
jgi:SAM-dependent methyltransferase